MIKNYTSTVPVIRSLANIEERLVKHGAKSTLKNYSDKGIIEAFCFILIVNGKEIPFKLPARVSNVEIMLRKQIIRPRPGTLNKIHEQAERTAWKLISDWIDIQISLVEIGQVEIMEVLLPYVYFPNTKETYFERLKGNGFKLIGMNNHERP